MNASVASRRALVKESSPRFVDCHRAPPCQSSAANSVRGAGAILFTRRAAEAKRELAA